MPYDLLARQALDAGFGRPAAGVVVFDVSGRVLMLRRKPDDVLPGLWDYPAGGLEDGERPDAGAARELFEESGIQCTDVEYVRALDFTDSRGRRTRQFVFTATVPDGTAVTPTEHDAYTWADLDDLPPTSDGHREVLGWLQRLRARPGWRPVAVAGGGSGGGAPFGRGASRAGRVRGGATPARPPMPGYRSRRQSRAR
ncbi:NUDIX hydrolase [Kitasatospora sp. RG8]|nr:NUDIX hydrolase [Kitasatospora sp. RG8]